jgi:adenylate kinase family enzyme
VKIIICLSGAIASGKTTIAQGLHTAWPSAEVRSFGDVVRRRAISDGKPLVRSVLQETGLTLISEGWPYFVEALVSDVPSDADLLLVDGIRHVEASLALHSYFPDAATHTIYLRVDRETLRARILERGESEALVPHSVEQSLAQVEEYADIVISSRLAASVIVSTISGLIRAELRV